MTSTCVGMSTDRDFSMETVFCEWLTLIHCGKSTHIIRGPMTIYGPSSANYDDAVRPILMTDWNHRSAFEDFYLELTKGPPNMSSILLNGTGTGNPHPLTFEIILRRR